MIEDFGYPRFQEHGEWGDYVSSLPRDDRGFIKLADVAEARRADLEAGRD